MPWSHRSGRGDLNPRPPAPKAGALPLRHSPDLALASVSRWRHGVVAGRVDAQGMDEHRIELKDGRTLAVGETGDPGSGRVIVFCHPAPGSRVLDPDPAATAAAGVRLITVDRPGSGESSPLAAGTVPAIPTFAGDIVAALDHLGVDEVWAAGWCAR